MGIFSGVALTIQSCKHDVIQLPPGGDTPTVSDDCDPDTVYFQNDILPIIVSNCAMSGCHDARSHQDGVVLDNYMNIVTTGEIKPGDPGDSELFEAITETDPEDIMPPPPSSPLSSNEIALIETWILQGALNNQCNECDTTNVSYASHVEAIIGTNCKGCHSGSNPQGGLLLETYDQVKSAVNNKDLVGRINLPAGAVGVMPEAGPMTDCNISTIEIWVNNGMPL